MCSSRCFDPQTSSIGVISSSGQLRQHNRLQPIPDGDRSFLHNKQLLKAASSFIWLTFNELQPEPKDYDQVTLQVQNFISAPPTIFSSTINNTIFINSDYIQNYAGDTHVEFTGILFHRPMHVWQWNGNGKAPVGLINGVADYVRLKAGWAPTEWPKKGSGVRWDKGFAVTAYFLDYYDGLKSGFVAELNGLMKNDFSDGYFRTLFGKTVDELWADYKSQFGSSKKEELRVHVLPLTS